MTNLAIFLQSKINSFRNYLNKNQTNYYFIIDNEVMHLYSLKLSSLKFVETFAINEVRQHLKNLIQSKKINKKGNFFIFFNNYPIELIEKPNSAQPLGKDDLFNIVQFQLSDYISFPVENASYDVLSNNNEESSFFKKYFTAFVVKKNELENIIHGFRFNGLKVSVADNNITGLRDFFGLYNNSGSDKTSVNTTAYIKLCDEKAFITIYQNFGVVISRSFNLSSQIQETQKFIENNKHLFQVNGIIDLQKNSSHLEMSPINEISDKISLELQRMTDYLDRQYNISPFTKLIYVHDNNPIFKYLEDSIYSSFSITKDSNDHINKILNNISYSNPFEFEIAALSLRSNFTKETINLLNKPNQSSNQQLVIDLKKILALCALAGLAFTVVGSYFYIQKQQQQEVNEKISKQIKNFETQISTINTSSTIDSVNKEINDLEQSKNNLLLLNPIKQQNQKILADLSKSAKSNNLFLQSITIDANGWKVEGVSLAKENIVNFLNSISQDSSFNKANVRNIQITPSKQFNNNLFTFTFEGNLKEIINIKDKDSNKK